MSIWDSNNLFKAQQAKNDESKMLFYAEEEHKREEKRIKDQTEHEIHMAVLNSKNQNVTGKEMDKIYNKDRAQNKIAIIDAYDKVLRKQQAKDTANTYYMKKLEALGEEMRQKHEELRKHPFMYWNQYDLYNKEDALQEEYEKRLNQIDIEFE